MDKSLTHYASPYYDPVKAHEYYMRTRELKGRRPASKLTDEGKEVWNYTKNQISESKKADVEVEKQKRDAEIEKLRTKADTAREHISARLKTLNEALNSRTKSEKEAVTNKREAELRTVDRQTEAAIKRLMNDPIPVEGISKKERAKLVLERREKLAKLRSSAQVDKAHISNTSSSDTSAITEKHNATKQQYSDEAKTERSKVASDLKSAVSAAREAYKAAKTALDKSYETTYQTEYDKILSEYQKTKKS